MSPDDRKQEVIDICLETFMSKGLSHTSTKDLCNALNLNSGGVFWYFKTKDEIIIACAEEAAIRIENDLIGTALNHINNPEIIARDLHDRSIKMRPLMKFFVSVCSSSKYEEAIQPALDNLSKRYKLYCEKFAEKLCCSEEEVAPYVYIVINTMLSYMIFGKKSFAAPQLKMVYNETVRLLEKRDKNIKKENKNIKEV